MGFLRRLIRKVFKRSDSSAAPGSKLADGGAQAKVSGDGHISAAQMERWELERRKKDKVDELIAKNGFYNCCHGRSGYIYCVEDGHLCEMYYEASGSEEVDIALWPLSFRTWDIPEGEKIPQDKRLEILYKLRAWLKEQKLRAGIDLPTDMEFEDKPCIWKGCGKQKIKGSVYCLRHYDLNLLGE